MKVSKLISILSKMPKDAKVYFRDYGVDYEKFIDPTHIKYEKGKGVRIWNEEDEPSEWEHVVDCEEPKS